MLFMTNEFDKSFRYNTVVESFRYDQTGPDPALSISKRPLGMTRRGFLAVAGNAMVAAGVAKVAREDWSPRALDVPPAPAETNVIEEAEEIGQEVQTETLLPHESFRDQLEAYRQQFTMGNEVLFVDQVGRVLGRHPIEPIDGLVPGAGYDKNYGVVTDGFDSAWRQAAETAVLRNHPTVSSETVEMRTNWNELRHAVSDQDETMTYENTHSIEDIVRYFGNKVVRDGDGLTRIEYIRERMIFVGNLAQVPLVGSELRRLMPGLCALESKFNDDVQSGTGARGIFQFMPETWEKELGREAFQKDMLIPLVEQAAAAGELFSKMYDRLQYWCYEGENYSGQNYLEIIKGQFTSQAAFEKYFLVPCLINAYNTGERGIGEVVVAFAKSVTFQSAKKTVGGGGYDVFQTMCDFARDSELSQLSDYKTEASTYVQRVYAWAELLADDKDVIRVAGR